MVVIFVIVVAVTEEKAAAAAAAVGRCCITKSPMDWVLFFFVYGNNSGTMIRKPVGTDCGCCCRCKKNSVLFLVLLKDIRTQHSTKTIIQYMHDDDDDDDNNNRKYVHITKSILLL